MHFADGARDAHVVAGNRAGEIARREIALMRPGELIALLLHMERVLGAAGGKFDTHVPSAGEIGRGRLGRFRIPRGPLAPRGSGGRGRRRSSRPPASSCRR